MFLPISLRPPRGMIFSFSAIFSDDSPFRNSVFDGMVRPFPPGLCAGKWAHQNRDASVRPAALHRRRRPEGAPVCRGGKGEGGAGREWTSGASRLYMNARARRPRSAYKNVRLRPVGRNGYTQYSTFIRVCTVFPFAFFPGPSTGAKNPRKIHCERREDML